MSTPLPFEPIAEAAGHWAKHWGDETTPSMRAVTPIMRAHQIPIGRLNEALAPFDLAFPRYCFCSASDYWFAHETSNGFGAAHPAWRYRIRTRPVTSDPSATTSTINSTNPRTRATP